MILVLGGGMAGLTAAARAAELGHDVTVVQRGHRLGGKGASHRTADGRIEEHGLHIWPGYYDNAFALLRRIHGTADDADPPGLFPAPFVGVAGDAGAPWMARFSSNDRRPGVDVGSPTVAQFARQCGELLTDLLRSTSAAESPPPAPRVYLSGSPRPRRPGASASPLRMVNQLVTTLLATSITYVPRVLQAAVPVPSPSVALLLDEIQRAATDLRPSRGARPSSLDQAIDLIMTCLLGVYRDGLLTHPMGFAAVNDLDFRAWLGKHGAAPTTVDCGIVRGMYDLTFGYRGGDHEQPAFEAGTGLTLAARFFFDFKGALFWKMRAGMGEVVFAPLYTHLKALDVRFEFFHRLHNLGLDASGTRIESVDLRRQVRLAPGVDEYRPLVEVNGMHVFPKRPLVAQLAVDEPPVDLESHDGVRVEEEPIVLRAGDDFDAVILATSLGMVPHVCAEIIARSERWQAMVDNVAVVATQALQLWAEPTERELGWEHPGSTVAGYAARFDTYAEMSHLIDVEATGRRTGSISYFCSALPDEHAEAGEDRARAVTRHNAERFLNDEVGLLWPKACDADGFRWELLVSDRSGSEALDDQYYAANVDPSDRYVQSLPGTGKFRLRADDSGVDNLFLAGDWIDSGLNAGCIEAATIAGIQAANAACGLPLCEGVVGDWRPVHDRHRSETTGERQGHHVSRESP